MAYRRLSSDELIYRSQTAVGLRGGRDVALASESGLYKLVMRRDKPEARAFQDWVTRVVLPATRKDGGYIAGEEKLATGEMGEDEFLARALLVAHRKIERRGRVAASAELHEAAPTSIARVTSGPGQSPVLLQVSGDTTN
jgi:prophage antirepressor-like protein